MSATVRTSGSFGRMQKKAMWWFKPAREMFSSIERPTGCTILMPVLLVLWHFTIVLEIFTEVTPPPFPASATSSSSFSLFTFSPLPHSLSFSFPSPSFYLLSLFRLPFWFLSLFHLYSLFSIFLYFFLYFPIYLFPLGSLPVSFFMFRFLYFVSSHSSARFWPTDK